MHHPSIKKSLTKLTSQSVEQFCLDNNPNELFNQMPLQLWLYNWISCTIDTTKVTGGTIKFPDTIDFLKKSMRSIWNS